MRQQLIPFYRVERSYFRAAINRRLLFTTNSLESAQAHCSDPESGSATCTSKTGKARTRKIGPWFDTYREVTK